MFPEALFHLQWTIIPKCQDLQAKHLFEKEKNVYTKQSKKLRFSKRTPSEDSNDLAEMIV